MELFQTQQHWVSLTAYLRELRDKQQNISINQYLQLYNAEANTTIENFFVLVIWWSYPLLNLQAGHVHGTTSQQFEQLDIQWDIC